jgi:hypothetical protein
MDTVNPYPASRASELRAHVLCLLQGIPAGTLLADSQLLIPKPVTSVAMPPQAIPNATGCISPVPPPRAVKDLREIMAHAYSAIESARACTAAILERTAVSDEPARAAALEREATVVATIEAVLVAADGALELADRECAAIAEGAAALSDDVPQESTVAAHAALVSRVAALHAELRARLPPIDLASIVPADADGPTTVRALCSVPGALLRLEALDLSHKQIGAPEVRMLSALAEVSWWLGFISPSVG